MKNESGDDWSRILLQDTTFCSWHTFLWPEQVMHEYWTQN